MAQIADLPGCIVAESVALHAAQSMGYALGDILASVVGHDEAAAGNKIDEALECCLDGIEVGVDVGVVEFDMGEDEGVGEVV